VLATVLPRLSVFDTSVFQVDFQRATTASLPPHSARVCSSVLSLLAADMPLAVARCRFAVPLCACQSARRRVGVAAWRRRFVCAA